MNQPNTKKLLSPDEAAEEVTSKHLQGKFQGMSDDMSGLWARAIAIEEREAEKTAGRIRTLQEQYPNLTEEQVARWYEAMETFPHLTTNEALQISKDEAFNTVLPEMAKELKEKVSKSREETKELMKGANTKRIRRGFKESLENNDYFEAMAFWDDAEDMEIDLSDILETTETKLNIKSLETGMIPLSSIA